MTLEELEALPVGSRIHETVPDRGMDSYSKYVKNDQGAWVVYDSDNPLFDLYREMGQLPFVTSEDFTEFGTLQNVVSIISAEEAAA